MATNDASQTDSNQPAPTGPAAELGKYATLTILQKKKICEYAEKLRREKKKMSGNELCDWAKDAFKLPKRPSQPTISRILRQSKELCSRPDSIISKKIRDRPGKNHLVEKVLYSWIRDVSDLGIQLNGESIREKGAEFQEIMNKKLTPGKQIVINFSEGWLSNFKQRWGLKKLKPSVLLDPEVPLPPPQKILDAVLVVRQYAMSENVSSFLVFNELAMMEAKLRSQLHEEHCEAPTQSVEPEQTANAEKGDAPMESNAPLDCNAPIVMETPRLEVEGTTTIAPPARLSEKG